MFRAPGSHTDNPTPSKMPEALCQHKPVWRELRHLELNFLYKTEGRRPIKGPTNFISALIQFCFTSRLSLPKTNCDKPEAQGTEKQWHVQIKKSCLPSFPPSQAARCNEAYRQGRKMLPELLLPTATLLKTIPQHVL